MLYIASVLYISVFELILYLIFTVSPVQVRSNRWVHLLFFSQIEFFKNAQKPHKKAVKTDCIYFDRFFWLLQLDSNHVRLQHQFNFAAIQRLISLCCGTPLRAPFFRRRRRSLLGSLRPQAACRLVGYF